MQFVHFVDNLWLHDIAISLYIFLIIDSLLANATAGSSKQYNPCHTNKVTKANLLMLLHSFTGIFYATWSVNLKTELETSQLLK